jgi:L-ribulose-5-phosphate 3-epimerase
MTNFSRRSFLSTASLAPIALGVQRIQSADPVGPSGSLQGIFYKTLKEGMVRDGATKQEKFQLAKEAGFSGIELNAPGFDIEEVNAAVKATGLVVDGTVCADHWSVRHSDPDASVRERALKTLLRALEDTHSVGGHTVLLVVGHGKDGTPEEVWNRSVENISLAIPTASRLGVTIAVENVWNEFCYDPKGDSGQTAAEFARYIDAFNSPWVGMQFDIGNHWKYGKTGDWIRTLGKRIVKLDVKGFSRKENKFTNIGDGDIDFADVRNALLETGFHGWCAAEVAGGDLARLKEVSANMDRAFGLES